MNKLEFEKFREQSDQRKLKALDRHELSKVIENIGLEPFNFESSDSMRETIFKYVSDNKISVSEVVFL